MNDEKVDSSFMTKHKLNKITQIEDATGVPGLHQRVD